MEDLKDPKMRKSRVSRMYIPAGTYVLRPGTMIAAVIAVILAQMALAIPAVLNGLFQQDLGTSSSQLTWISDAFFVPVCMLELSSACSATFLAASDFWSAVRSCSRSARPRPC